MSNCYTAIECRCHIWSGVIAMYLEILGNIKKKGL